MKPFCIKSLVHEQYFGRERTLAAQPGYAFGFMIGLRPQIARQKLALLHINKRYCLQGTAYRTVPIDAFEKVMTRSRTRKPSSISSGKVDIRGLNRCSKQGLPKRFWQPFSCLLQRGPMHLDAEVLVEKTHRSPERKPVDLLDDDAKTKQPCSELLRA